MSKDDIADAVAKGVEAGLMGALQKLGVVVVQPPAPPAIRTAADMRDFARRRSEH